MTELNEIFEQIFHAELKFKVRTDKLKQLAQSIEQSKSELLQIGEQYRTKQGELAVKNNTLADLEVEVKLLTLRKGILQEQRDSLVENKRQIAEELDKEKREYEEEYQSFKRELTEFGCSYDLHGAGYQHRQEETKKKIELFQDELLLLKTELAEMEVQREEVSKLEMELSEAEETLEQEKAKSEELMKVIFEQEEEIKKLEEVCSTVSERLSKDPDFIRLQRELESCKQCPEEVECKAASRQLQELQQKCYHQQMRQQLNRQKSCIQNKSLDSGSRQPGHYNPYTHRYVPAPQTAATSSFGRESRDGLVQRSNTNSGRTSVQKEKFQEDNLKLVDDEWLMTGEEEYLEEREWDMAGFQDEMEEADIGNIDSDWSNFDDPDNGDDNSSQQLSNHNSHVTNKSLTTSSHPLQKVNAQSTSTGTSQPKYVPLKPKGSVRSTTRRADNITNDHQAAHSLSEEPQRQFFRSRSAALYTTTSTRHDRTHGKTESRVSNNTAIPSAVFNEASPEPGRILRKRSGQSIYKSPGSKPTNISLSKKAKKVRFHY